MSSKIFDDFQEMFHDESEFIDSIRDMENNSEWPHRNPSQRASGHSSGWADVRSGRCGKVWR